MKDHVNAHRLVRVNLSNLAPLWVCRLSRGLPGNTASGNDSRDGFDTVIELADTCFECAETYEDQLIPMIGEIQQDDSSLAHRGRIRRLCRAERQGTGGGVSGILEDRLRPPLHGR